MDPILNTDIKELKHVCAVCEEEAAGFHFGAFTCEGCKSFFGRATEEAKVTISDCKTGGKCNIKGRSRTSCKSCRLAKCQLVGMSRQRSRYGRRSTYFKVQCLLDAQQEHHKRAATLQPGSNADTKRMKMSPSLSSAPAYNGLTSSIYPSINVMSSVMSYPHSSVIKSTAGARVHKGLHTN